MAGVCSEYSATATLDMKLTLSILAAIFAVAAPATAQEVIAVNPVPAQYRNISPEFRCHYKLKNRTFCRSFPNLSRKWNVCDPAYLGNIEWCREDVTITDRDDCGNYETYEALVVTYRPIYENGAWGEKFRRTYRKEAFAISVPPVISK